MKNINLLVLLLISLHVPFSYAAQESQIQDEPFVIVSFDQFLDQTVKNFPEINQTFVFLQEKHLVNTSFRQFLQARLVRNDVEDEANFGEVLGQAQDLITQNMKWRFIKNLDIAIILQKALDQFDDSIFLYVMQHKDGCMHDMVHHWLLEWNRIQYNNGVTPLHRAAFNNHTEITHLLITAGADVNIQDNKKWTLLHFAVNNQSQDVVKILIAAHADVNIKNNEGQTPLHRVAYYDINQIFDLLIQREIVNLLIIAGADLNIQNNRAETVLHIATGMNNTYIAHMLIAAGADINIEDQNGKIAQQRAYTDKMKNLFVQARMNREGIHNQHAACCTIS